jgi:hypothetical protein
VMVFVLVIGLAGVFWGVGWWIERRLERKTTAADPIGISPK